MEANKFTLIYYLIVFISDIHLSPKYPQKNILFREKLLEWKGKFETQKTFKLTRPQADYVLKYHETTPKVARKYINLVSTFGEKLMEDKLLSKAPEKIWCEKLLCESDKAYHIWGKVLDSEQNTAFWLPKAAVVQEEKKLNRVKIGRAHV